MQNIKRYNLPYSPEDIEFVQKNIEKVLQKGYLTDGGEYVAKFEEEWANIVGKGQAVAVNSCTTALEVILRAIGVKGASVVVPTYTFFATPMAVHHAGGAVIYADISKKTLSLSLESVKEAVRSNTKAVIIVHVGGIVSSEIDEIRDFCFKKGIFLIEDAACAHGASFKGRNVGTLGHYSAFSFHHSKVLTTGEGGMIVTSEPGIEKMKRLRAIGLDRSVNNWEVFELGNNYKMSEITAVLGLLHCQKSDAIFNERRQLAEYYDREIEFNSLYQSFEIPADTTSAYYKYIILAENEYDKEYFTDILKMKYNIELPPTVYDYMCHEQKINSKISHVHSSEFHNAREMMERNICLPMYCGLAEDQRKYIVESVNEVING